MSNTELQVSEARCKMLTEQMKAARAALFEISKASRDFKDRGALNEAIHVVINEFYMDCSELEFEAKIV